MAYHPPSHATLTPPWLHLARAFWLPCFLAAVLLFILGFVNQVSQPPISGCDIPGANCPVNVLTREDLLLAEEMGFSASDVTYLAFGGMALAKLPFIIVGLIIFARKSNDWVALMLSMTLVLWTLEGIYSLGPLQPVANGLYLLDAILFFVILFIFPNGRFVPGWTRWIVLPYLLFALPVMNNPGMTGPLIVVSVVWLALMIYALAYRYTRVSTPAERQQTKWVIVGFLSSFLGAAPWIAMNIVFPSSQASPERLWFIFLALIPLSALSYLAVSFSVAFAILRYRLWDIDLIIRRTLLYGLLTLLLGLLYFGMVVLLGQAILAFSGRESPLAIVLSTLAIAALFNPLRRSIQAFIDRRFYRRKYNAEQAVASFSAAARNQVELEVLAALLADTARETLQPERVSLWLRKQENQQ